MFDYLSQLCIILNANFHLAKIETVDESAIDIFFILELDPLQYLLINSHSHNVLCV